MIQIDLPYLLPGLNGREGLMRIHWTKRRALAKTVQWDIVSQTFGLAKGAFSEVRITYTAYRHRLMDWDNFASSFKLIGDALKAAGVIKDDSPKFVRDFVLRQEAIKRVEKARTVVQVELYENFNKMNKKVEIPKKTKIIPRFSYDAEGYSAAQVWLKEIGEWERVSTSGFSTDGWSIIETANVIWEKRK